MKNISAPRSPFPPFVSLRAFSRLPLCTPKSHRTWNYCLSPPPPFTTFSPSFSAAPPAPPLRPIELPSLLPSLLVLGSNGEDLGFAGRGAGDAIGAALFLLLPGRKCVWGGWGKGGKNEGSALSLHPPFPQTPELLQQVEYFPQAALFIYLFICLNVFFYFLRLMNEKDGSKPRSAPRPPASPAVFAVPFSEGRSFF